MLKMKKVIVLISMGILLVGCTGKNQATATDIPENVQEIYEAKNPYIGDNSADSKLLGLLTQYYGISEEYTLELLTNEEPYVMIVHFDSQPVESKMWDVSACLLALTENCSEVRWEYDEYIFYVPKDDANANLNIKDIKDYGQSAEEFNSLLSKLEEN